MTDYLRIKQIMDYLNYSSDKKFAEAIGVSPQNLYDIKAEKKGLTSFIADKILDRFPQFSKAFLMFGEGEMLMEDVLERKPERGRHNGNGTEIRYIAHLEEEIALLRKEKEELWAMVQRLMK